MCNPAPPRPNELLEAFTEAAFQAVREYSTGLALNNEPQTGPHGPSSFAPQTFKAIPDLAERLRHRQTAPYRFLRTRFSPATQGALAAYRGRGSNPEPLTDSLARDLNRLIEGQSIYTTGIIHQDQLRAQTRNLLATNPEGPNLVRLNRLVLEDAFPEHIWRGFEFIGSGTFIRWGQHHGVLTAAHVLENENWRLDTDPTSVQHLRLFLGERANEFALPAYSLQVLSLPGNRKKRFGPDLAVIVLPTANVGAIQASKSFYNLTIETAGRLAGALDQGSCLAFSGFPAEDMRDIGPAQGFQENVLAQGLIAFTEQVSYYERGPHDYLIFGSTRDDYNNAPTDYGGVSGGSAWRVPPRPPGENAIRFTRVYLAGVPIVQGFKRDGRTIFVRCHGPQSIYRDLLRVLPA
jgi:hypothetical protein